MKYKEKKTSYVGRALAVLFVLNQSYAKDPKKPVPSRKLIEGVKEQLSKGTGEEVVISSRQIRRYIQFLNDSHITHIHGAPGVDGGYTIDGASEGLTILSNDDIIALVIALSRNDDVTDLMAKFPFFKRRLNPDFYFNTKTIGYDELYSLVDVYKAIDARAKIKLINYINREGKSVKEQIITPVGITAFKGQNYIIGIDENWTSGFKLYRPERIGSSIEIQREGSGFPFKREKVAAWVDKDSFGLRDKEKERIEVKVQILTKFSNLLMDTFDNKPIQLKDATPGMSTFLIYTHNLDEVANYLTHFIGGVRIIAPNELKRIYLDKLQFMKENAEKLNN
jgi:predicted DNA-binding transcriptional regulator YafY